MTNHNVKLNYTPTGFTPHPNPITVHKGDTIAFQLGQGPPNGKVRITFADPQFFSTARPHFQQTGRVDDGDGDVTVVAALPKGSRITYKCELLVDGQRVAQNQENAGGEVIP